MLHGSVAKVETQSTLQPIVTRMQTTDEFEHWVHLPHSCETPVQCDTRLIGQTGLSQRRDLFLFGYAITSVDRATSTTFTQMSVQDRFARMMLISVKGTPARTCLALPVRNLMPHLC